VKRKLVCLCEYEFEDEIPESVDLGKEPHLEQAILSGEFLTSRCPNCGKLLKPEFPVLIRDPAMESTLYFVPELDRGPFYRGALSYPIGEVTRVAIGYDELVEKFLIKKAGLDDRVVEVLKYYLLQKALDSAAEEREVRILFFALEGDTLVFHAHGLKDGEVGVLNVSRQMADKVASQLEEKRRQDPFNQILAGPYVSVNKLMTETPE
jgi:hypothetical protein